MTKRQRLLVAILLAAAAPVWAAEETAAPVLGRPVAEVIDDYRDDGYPFAYSTSLVGPELRVLAEPSAGTPVDIVKQILQPHGLTIRTDSGIYLVVRKDSRTPDTVVTAPSTVDASRPAEMESVIVSASRYAISRDIATSQFSIDQRTVQGMPDVGEDPIRVTQRLPGAAASGGSAIAHLRGGETGEIGIMLNGQWLFDPFHIRDYQNIFSAIDARAIQGVEVYTGGFPVRYGDRMSGLVLMDSIESEKPRHSEIGISVFNSSALTMGTSGNKSWLMSARRGNLDIVIDPKYGRPSYFDVFGEFAYEISPNMRISANALYAEDGIRLVLETEPAERDEISSDTRNAQLWLRLDSRWSETLTSTTVLSAVDYSNHRVGFANDQEKMVADVSDHREIRQIGIRQDWAWSPNETHWSQWGLSATTSEASFDYVGSAEYFGLQSLYEGRPPSISRSVIAKPKGGSYAIYASDRWKVGKRSILEWGLRWDDQTYTDLSSDSQLSPRMSFLVFLSENTELRMSAGRYFQSQAIQSLQVEDGVTNFWPAQRADHLILGARHLFDNGTSLRVEMFIKELGQVRPRFENLFDPLGLMPELQRDRVLLAPSSARARGLEISADQAIGNFAWWASYTGSRVTDRIDDVDVLRSWDQRHSVQAGFDWKKERWNFSAAASVHSGWPTTGLTLDDEGFVVPGARNMERHGTYASLDFRVSRRFDVKRGSLLAFLEISNALNRKNECCIDWDIIENSAGDDALERGKDFWMPRLPAIGILWEF